MKVQAIILSLLLTLLCGTPALAHEGKTHVMGTVTAGYADHVVVTDRDGKTVSIGLSKGTKYEKDNAPAAAGDLKVGDRVVIDVTGKPDNLTATEIRFSSAPPPPGRDGAHQHADHP